MGDLQVNLLIKVVLETATKEDFLAISSIPNDLWNFFSANSARKTLKIFGLKPLRGHSDFSIDEVVGNAPIGKIRYRVHYENFEGEITLITHSGSELP